MTRRIMRLGDSITVGYSTLDGGTFAGQLAPLAPWSFVGSVGGVHEGHGGYLIAQIASGLDAWMSAAMPTDVALMIGTNDAAMGTAETSPGRVKTALAELRTLVLRIASKISGRVVIATIPPATGPFKYAVPFTIAYNAGIVAMVQQLAREGYRVQLADADKAMDTSMLSSDGVHPNVAGYKAIGQVFGFAFAHPESAGSSTKTSAAGVVVVVAIIAAALSMRRKRG